MMTSVAHESFGYDPCPLIISTLITQQDSKGSCLILHSQCLSWHLACLALNRGSVSSWRLAAFTQQLPFCYEGACSSVSPFPAPASWWMASIGASVALCTLLLFDFFHPQFTSPFGSWSLRPQTHSQLYQSWQQNVYSVSSQIPTNPPRPVSAVTTVTPATLLVGFSTSFREEYCHRATHSTKTMFFVYFSSQMYLQSLKQCLTHIVEAP